jgi:hypothetical protein
MFEEKVIEALPHARNRGGRSHRRADETPEIAPRWVDLEQADSGARPRMQSEAWQRAKPSP